MQPKFETLSEMRNQFGAHHKATAEILKSVSGDERGPFGLTPDYIKAKPQWRAAYRDERAAFQRLADFNRFLSKNYQKELRAERDAKRVKVK